MVSVIEGLAVAGGFVRRREDVVHDLPEDPPAGGDRPRQFFWNFLVEIASGGLRSRW